MSAIRSLIALCLLFLILQPCFAQTGLRVRATVSDCLNLRSDHDVSSNSIACLPPGTEVTLVQDIPYWRKVRLVDGREGWTAKKYLEPVTPPQTAPSDSPIPTNAWLKVHFVDVGQGDAIWIQTFDDGIDGNGIFEGKNIIIDGGPDPEDSKNKLYQYIKSRIHPNADIDALIVTHPHADHFNGADTILRHFEVKKYYDPGYANPDGYPVFLDSVRSEIWNGQPATIMRGKSEFDTLDWGREIKAEILYSYPDLQNITNINDSSIVLRLQYGEHSFLFMGDAEGKSRDGNPQTAKYVEKWLLEKAPDKLKSTVLKIGHHGSETSSTVPFINAVDPMIVVVCSGRQSFSGSYIPKVSTLKRYCCHSSETKIYRTDYNDEQEGRTTATDQDGDNVIVETNGQEIKINAYSNGSPIVINDCRPVCN
jgi:competence protein ComEC